MHCFQNLCLTACACDCVGCQLAPTGKTVFVPTCWGTNIEATVPIKIVRVDGATSLQTREIHEDQ